MGRRHRSSRGRPPVAFQRAVAQPEPRNGRAVEGDPSALHLEPRPDVASAAAVEVRRFDPGAQAPPDRGERGAVTTAVAPPIDGSAGGPSEAPSGSAEGVRPRSTATSAQLRRFIKSRPYVPLHELRRRFGLNGHDDDVAPLDLGTQTVWVGLPPDESRMLADLVRQGDVGCELSVDPATPVVIGVFPMRPVSRP